MMRRFFYIMLAVLICPLALSAAPRRKQADTGGMAKGSGKVYLVGMSQQLTDSTAYITDVIEVDSIDLERKTKFLPYRSEFSMQLKEYLEGTKKQHKQTACVYYSTKLKKMVKIRTKLKKRYINMEGMKVVLVGKDEFSFKHPFDSFTANEPDK